jgi:hypothetical protein
VVNNVGIYDYDVPSFHNVALTVEKNASAPLGTYLELKVLVPVFFIAEVCRVALYSYVQNKW